MVIRDSHNQGINPKSGDSLQKSIRAFLQDRRSQNMAAGTLEFYQTKLSLFLRFCEGQGVENVSRIDADLLRRFMVWLEETQHNPGGQHTFYRSVKTFLKWWERENEPQGWNNPIDKVRAPRLPVEPLEPVSLDTVRLLLDQCGKDFAGTRDRAMILFLLDTGCRASELLAIDLADVNIITGEVLIRSGKGKKPRYVFIGIKTRRELRRHLRSLPRGHTALFSTQSGERLTYSGLRSMMLRRASQAGVKAPQLHAFRRAFALTMLRANVDIFTLQKLMGHADLQVLRRYLAQNDEDLREAHRRASPGDAL